MIDSFNIIVVSLSDSTGIEIKNKVEQKFKSLPSKFQFVNSGDQALYLLGTGVYQLVITDYEMPGMNGKDLVREIRKNDGGISIILMAPQDVKLAKESFELVTTPIADWNQFLSLVQGAIPDSLQTQYGIKSHDPILDKLLKNRAQELFGEEEQEYTDGSKPFILLPKWMLGRRSNAEKSTLQDTDFKFVDTDEVKTFKTIREKGLEFMVLGFIISFCLIWLYKYANEENSEITIFIQVITALSCFGFFVSQMSERLYNKYKSNNHS